MSTLRFNIILILALWLVTSCNVRVVSTRDKKYFKGKKTYAWIEEPATKTGFNRELKRKVIEVEIQKEVEEKLKANGFEYNENNPDFIVNYKALYTKERFDNKVSKSSLSGYTGSSTMNLSSMPVAQNSLSVGIQLLDPATKTVLWSGTTSRSLGDVMTLTKIVDKEVKKVVKKMPQNKRKLF